MEFNLADLFEAVVDAVPERVALVVGDERIRFAELDARANQVAHFLRARGVRPGEHIGLHLYNGAPFVVGMLAAFKIRAVPINVNYRYVADELHYLFDNADLRVLFTQSEVAERTAGALEQGVDSLHTVVLVDGPDPALPDALPYEPLADEYPSERGFESRSGKDLLVVYTGGTTGMPRGVMWQHEDLLFAALQGGNPGDDPLETPEQIGPNVLDREPMHLLPAAPFIHGSAQFSFWIASLTGGKVVIVPGPSFLPGRTWELVEREKVGVVNLVGDAMARPFVEHPGEFDVPELYCVTSAGAILSRTVRSALQKRLPYAMILNNFGATETGHQGVAMYDDDPGARPRFFMKEGAALLDEKNQRISEPGVVGRIARGGRIPLGYYNDPEKTARTFVKVDGERYVVPGDMGVLDDEGFIDLLGRGAVCINTGGEKVYPEEVEEALKDHSAVLDALVVGLPDPKWQQRVAAVVQLREGKQAGPEELDAWCRTRVAGYKVPRVYVFEDRIGRQPSGKPDYAWAAQAAAAAVE